MKEKDDATGDAKAGYPLRAVDRVCDILDLIADSTDGVSMSDVAQHTEMPKSSTFRYLAALEARNYVSRDDSTGLFKLGLAFRPQDTRYLDHLAELAQPAMDRLRDDIEETVNLGVLDGSQINHIVVSESPHMMRLAARVGERGPVHSTALGKVISSTLPEAHVRSLLESGGMPRYTDSTIVDPAEFLREIVRVGEAGYGLDDAENQVNGRCVAVLIPGLKIPAGVSVSAPVERLPMHRIESVVNQLRELATTLSVSMLESRSH